MKKWLAVFFLFCMLGLLVYANGLNNKFLMDDGEFRADPRMSQTKYALSQWNPYTEEVRSLGYYRPMAHMLLNFLYGTFRDNNWEYHLLSIFLFALASSLVYIFVLQITGNFPLALLSGLFYLIHPINQVAVDYTSGIVFTFEVIFMLGSMLLLWSSLERSNDRTRYFLSLLLFFLSLFWHENAVMMSFYLAVVILLFRPESLKNKILYLFPYFLIVLGFLVFRLNFLGLHEPILEKIRMQHMTGGQYLGSLFQVYAWYRARLFYPKGIVLEWITPIVHQHIMLYAAALCLLIGLLGLLFIACSKQKIYRLGIAWLLIGFLPVGLAAFLESQNGVMIEPHWLIVPSIGFAISAAGLCLLVLERMRKTGVVLLFVVLFVWGYFSYASTLVWADQKTYALYWAKQAPNMNLPCFYLAQSYQNEGAFREAKKYYRKMLTRGVSSVGMRLILNNFGVMETQDKDFKQAELHYKMALMFKPDWAQAYHNLCVVYYHEGKFDKAQAFCGSALAFDPLLTKPRILLARMFLKQAEYQKAVELCLKNLDIINNDPETLGLLIEIFIQKKDFANIKKYAQRFVDSIDDPAALTILGNEMAQAHFSALALDCFQKAIRLAPDYGDAYLYAGKMLFDTGRYSDAVRLWKMGSVLNPHDQRFRRFMVQAEKKGNKISIN
ncbi:MAG: tetratricopeptide repeat protein [Candidatus Omnitrophica bacterium]|nr:tetratricopeptide repeat protein [Candidatus Omnitrophota bacterium]